jgi:hypothetical protein
MYAHSVAIPLVHRRRYAFFLARFTQQVQSASVIPELVRAGAALAVIGAWGAVLALIAG